MEKLQVEADTSPKTLMDLNDFCLIKILDNLKDLDDLTSIAECSLKLFMLAQDAFVRRHGHDYTINEKFKPKNLLLFGNQIHNLTIKTRAYLTKSGKLEFNRDDVRKAYRFVNNYCHHILRLETFLNTFTGDELYQEFLKELNDNKDKISTADDEDVEMHEYAAQINLLNDKTITKLLNYLSVDDLTTMAMTSKRFKMLASAVFQKAYGNDNVFDLDPDVKIPTIRIFGPYINSLTVGFNHYFYEGSNRMFEGTTYCEIDQLETFELINDYCPNVEELFITQPLHGKVFIDRDRNVRQVLGRLKKLIIASTRMKYDKEYYSFMKQTMECCENVTELNLTSWKSPGDPFLLFAYPQLDSIHINGEIDSNDAFTQFCRLNHNVTKMYLKLQKTNGSVHFDGLRYLSKLETLVFSPPKEFADFYFVYELLSEIETLRVLYTGAWDDSLCKIKTLTSLIVINTDALTDESFTILAVAYQGRKLHFYFIDDITVSDAVLQNYSDTIVSKQIQSLPFGIN